MATTETKAIVSGTGAIICTVMFLCLGIPMIIASIILFAINDMDFDVESYDHCSWSDNYDQDLWNGRCGQESNEYYSYSSYDCDCDETYEEYREAKAVQHNMYVAAVIMCTISSLMVVSGIVLVILMCTNLCKKSEGQVHRQMPAHTVIISAQPGYTYNWNQAVAVPPNQAPQPMAMQPPQPIAMQPPQPIAMQPPQPTAMQPAQPTAMQPPQPTAMQPPQPIAMQPPQPIAMQPPPSYYAK